MVVNDYQKLHYAFAIAHARREGGHIQRRYVSLPLAPCWTRIGNLDTQFLDRFSRVMEMAPMEYLLAWRMALDKNLLKRGECSIVEVAERIGYSSVNTFSVAFTRHVGLPPRRYALEKMAAQ